jgi:rhodanese-related sulfurtransferase
MKRVKFIPLDQLLEMKTNSDVFTLIDVLSPENFKEGHLPGAINIPTEQIEQQSAGFDKKDTLIVYCAGYTCGASTAATRKLLDLGYKNTLDFKGGKKAWQEAGFDLESGQ